MKSQSGVGVDDVDGDHGDVCRSSQISDLERELVDPGEAGVRRIGECAGAVDESQRAVVRFRRVRKRQLGAVDVGRGQRCRQRRVVGGGEAVVAEDRGVIDRRHGDAHGRRTGRRVAVVGDVLKAVRAVVVLVRSVGERSRGCVVEGQPAEGGPGRDENVMVSPGVSLASIRSLRESTKGLPPE